MNHFVDTVCNIFRTFGNDFMVVRLQQDLPIGVKIGMYSLVAIFLVITFWAFFRDKRSL